MPPKHMHLKVLLPYAVFAEHPGVLSIVALSPEGSFGLLPHRLDCVSVLTPGILAFQTAQEAEQYIAVDAGLLVKTGFDVRVCVHKAIGGLPLQQLSCAVAEQFMQIQEDEKKLRSVLLKMESGFIQRLAKFKEDRSLW